VAIAKKKPQLLQGLSAFGRVCAIVLSRCDGIADRESECFQDHIRRPRRLRGRCGLRPTTSYETLYAGPRKQEGMRDFRRVRSEACVPRSSCRGRIRRRCLDRARVLSLADSRAECEASTRAHRSQSKTCNGHGELRGSTIGKGRGRWGLEDAICGRPNRPSWPACYSQICF